MWDFANDEGIVAATDHDSLRHLTGNSTRHDTDFDRRHPRQVCVHSSVFQQRVNPTAPLQDFIVYAHNLFNDPVPAVTRGDPACNRRAARR